MSTSWHSNATDDILSVGGETCFFVRAKKDGEKKVCDPNAEVRV